MPRHLACLALALAAGCGPEPSAAPIAKEPAQAAAASARPEPLPDIVRVRLETEAGPILLALDARRAPITTANFVRYVDERRFDGISFYRVAPTKGAPQRGFVQGGIRRNYRLMLPPIAHEPTSKTGLKHKEGTISMARAEDGAGAMGDFFILTATMPAMDAAGDKPGYAAFGKVESGMDAVSDILAAATLPDVGRGAMRGQMLVKPVRIASARRVE